MNSDKPSVSLLSSFTSKVRGILQSFNVICCPCHILKLRTGHQKTSICEKTLCNLPSHSLDATFLDKTPMMIQYVFDPTRRNRDYVLVKVDNLLPIFGGATPSTTGGFSSIMELCYFVKKKVHLDECDHFRHASCPCHLRREDQEHPDFVFKPSVNMCEHQHFHHFCWKHVVSWLYNYLNLVILLEQSKEHFDKEIAYLYSMFPEDIAYFQRGNRITPPFLFKTAMVIEPAEYENDNEQGFDARKYKGRT
ncbi:repeat element protein-d11.3 [Ichnoviriform fugitivi]|uniref:Repeat element protein-d11.3 n=1 Tax=Ichnoviriform fugitivi TaxID=265522 RepID=A2Q0N0_9VIRU|nr:repeat element protein-d11.3 [Ichnoviriform fugitivi]BAF45745.1 repeat element protein-d11.3 [Ichnoviriform fugitivi]